MLNMHYQLELVDLEHDQLELIKEYQLEYVRNYDTVFKFPMVLQSSWGTKLC